MEMPLRPHQTEALTKLKDGRILWGGVGSGKSRVALAYYMLTRTNEDVYVITTAKKRDSLDWEGEAAKFGIGKEKDATVAGVLTVDSWNNLHKYTNVQNAFFIFDEQRLVGGGKWSKTFVKVSRYNRWILLSATPGDTWLDFISVFVANGHYKNRTEFKREHVVYNSFAKYPKVDHYIGVQKLVRLRSRLLVKMRYDKETVRHDKNVWVDFDTARMDLVVKKRWNVYEDRPIQEVGELFHLMRQVANSDPSRAEALVELQEKHKRVVVFYTFNYELDIIRSLAGTLWQSETIGFAEWNGKKHEEIPETDQWVYAVQYLAGSEGWNCISTNCVVFWSLSYSYRQFEQAHGRIDRLNTPYVDLYYYILRSKSPIDLGIWRALKSKKDFQHSDLPV